jgi:hypothetical protein
MTVTEVADGAYGPSGVVPCRGRARGQQTAKAIRPSNADAMVK